MTTPANPFAAAEQRVNAAVMRKLANATCSIGGAVAIGCVFDQEYVVAEVGAAGMAATAPAVTVPTSAVPAAPGGAAVKVTGATGVTNWTVAEHHPDGAGLSVLLLERAP